MTRDIRENSQTSSPLMANWIRDGLRVSRLVATGNTDMIPVFWIRVYGILAEIGDHLARQVEVCAELAPNHPEFMPLLALSKTIENLAQAFTQDELVYLQYRRHTECHPMQDAYRLQLTPGGLRDEVTHRLIKSKMPQQETTDAITRVLLRAGAEHLIAIDFARRAEPRLVEVHRAAPAWLGPGTR